MELQVQIASRKPHGKICVFFTGGSSKAIGSAMRLRKAIISTQKDLGKSLKI
jgi:hypothetical protein